jgi:hypothetical protein
LQGRGRRGMFGPIHSRRDASGFLGGTRRRRTVSRTRPAQEPRRHP